MSPDGHAIVYGVYTIDIQHDSNDRTFWIVRLSGARAVPVLLPHISGPTWSPDGRTLAVVNYSSGRSTVQLLRGDTLEVVRNFAVPSSPGTLVWSPNGKSLAFTLFVPEKDAPSFLQQAVDTAEGNLDKPAGAQWAAPVQITQSAHYREDGGEWLQSGSGHRHLFVLSTVNGVVQQVGSQPFDDSEGPVRPMEHLRLYPRDYPFRSQRRLRLEAAQQTLFTPLLPLKVFAEFSDLRVVTAFRSSTFNWRKEFGPNKFANVLP